MAEQTSDLQVINGENEQEETFDILNADSASPDMFKNPSAVMFSSIENDGSRKSQVTLLNAINDTEHSLSDHQGEKLEITDIVAHTIEIEDEITKQPIKALRVVIIDKNGTGYHSVSQGVASSIQKVIAICGQPTWKEPVVMVPVERKTRKGFKTLTLKVVG